MKKLKTIPDFNSEKEEQVFWETHDSADYIDWSKAKKAGFPNLKKSTEKVSLEIPQSVIKQAKKQAGKLKVSYVDLLEQKLEASFEVRDS